MTFEYVDRDAELPKPKQTYTSSDLGIAIPIIMEFLDKMAEPYGDKLAVVAIQFKLEPNDDEADQEVEFLKRFPPKGKAEYMRREEDDSLFNVVKDRKTTPLDRIVYIFRS